MGGCEEEEGSPGGAEKKEGSRGGVEKKEGSRGGAERQRRGEWNMNWSFPDGASWPGASRGRRSLDPLKNTLRLWPSAPLRENLLLKGLNQ
jgi:hypothetical protein